MTGSSWLDLSTHPLRGHSACQLTWRKQLGTNRATVNLKYNVDVYICPIHVCIYMCVYIYIYVHVYIRTCCKYIYICIHMYVTYVFIQDGHRNPIVMRLPCWLVLRSLCSIHVPWVDQTSWQQPTIPSQAFQSWPGILEAIGAKGGGAKAAQ